MNTNREGLSRILFCAVFGLALSGAPARAELVSTEAVIGAGATAEARVPRPELVRELQTLGIPPEQAQARVDAMTDAEVLAVAGRLEALPAGSALSNNDLIVILLVIIIVLLVA
jgi:hypothetical protein